MIPVCEGYFSCNFIGLLSIYPHAISVCFVFDTNLWLDSKLALSHSSFATLRLVIIRFIIVLLSIIANFDKGTIKYS